MIDPGCEHVIPIHSGRESGASPRGGKEKATVGPLLQRTSWREGVGQKQENVHHSAGDKTHPGKSTKRHTPWHNTLSLSPFKAAVW